MRHTRSTTLIFAIALVATCALMATPASAQHRGGGRRGVVVVGGYYDPFWGPYYDPYPYGYPGRYPYPFYPRIDRTADVRLMVTPREAQVFVDGYYMGIVDNFDGVFQRLSVPPGDHEIVLFLQGYRTVHERVNLSENGTTKLRYTMERLGQGEMSEPPPQPRPQPEVGAPQPPDGRQPLPRGPRTGRPVGPPEPQGPARPQGRPEPANPPAPRDNGEYGTLAIRVQPVGAEILVDGEPWHNSDATSALLVQVSAGRHHVEVSKDGYRRFAIDIAVRAGSTAPLNVSLSPER